MKKMSLYSDLPRSRSKFFFLTIFILSILSGTIVSGIMKEQKDYILPDNAILPIPKELLQNPVLSGWSAHVKGRVIAKGNNTFTISHVIEKFVNRTRTIKDANDGKIMEIEYVPGITMFKQYTQSGIRNVEFGDLAVGSIVNGGITISQSNGMWKIIGGSFGIG